LCISSCFLARATHKFRSAFGKSRLVRDKEKVLVAYSGGKASSAMVHLIEQVLKIESSFNCLVSLNNVTIFMYKGDHAELVTAT